MIKFFLFSIHVSRTLGHDKKNLPAYIVWKFDYRLGNFYLTSLKLHYHSSNTTKIQWSVQLLPTRKKPNHEFKQIIFTLHDEKLDLTEMVKDEYGFILKVYMNGVTTYEADGKTYLFRKDKFDEQFCMDIEVELRPNMIF